MKKLIKCATSLHNIDELSYNQCVSIIKDALDNANYIQISYYDPFMKGTAGTAFKKIDGKWAWVAGKSGKLMNAGTPNEKNSLNLTNGYVLRQLTYALKHNDCKYLSVE